MIEVWFSKGMQQNKSMLCVGYEEAVLKMNILHDHTDTLFFLYIWIWSFLIFQVQLRESRAYISVCLGNMPG